MTRKSLLLFSLFLSLLATGQEYDYNYSFFTNSNMSGNWFYSKATCSGGSTILNVDGMLPVSESIFHTPGNSLEISFRNSAGGDWKAVIYHPDLRGEDHFLKPGHLILWVYNASEKVTHNEWPKLQLMGRDSSLSTIINFPVTQAGSWQRVVVSLDGLGGLDANEPEDILAIVFSRKEETKGGSGNLFIDDIEFLPAGPVGAVSQFPVITSAKGFAMHADITWEKLTDKNVHLVKVYRSENGGEFLPVGIQEPYICRYADFTGLEGKNYEYRISFLNSDYTETDRSSPVAVTTRAMGDEELLTMVQEASFRYYWEGAEAASGMARENIPGRQNMIATGASGFGIMALIVGTDRNFITREASVERFLKILDYLERAETFHGVYPHFMNGPTGKAEPFFGHRDNGADLVETSFLLEGLLAARQYFSGESENEKQIRERITAIWEKAEFDWFRRYPDSKFLYWHWSPDQEWVINHKLIGWNETMVVYLLAIASPTHSVPPEMYYSGWANQDKTGRNYRSNWGQSNDGENYTNGNTYYGIKLDVGVNNGGPLFFTHYSYMGYDPHLITDRYTNYFTNNQHIAQINYRYCVANPKQFKGYGEDGWGLTASDGPYDYSADEPVAWQDHGKLTPTGAISSFPYTPGESMKALKNYYYNYGEFLWGEYGFWDSFSLSENWCSQIYMGLNQAPMVVMIENYRTGLIWKLFMQNPEIREGLKKIEMTGK